MQTYKYAKCSFTNIDGIEYTISIEGTDANANEVIELTMSENGLSVSYDGDQSEHFGFISSSASFSFVGDESLFNILKLSSDLTFCVIISSSIFNWFGWVIADGLQKSSIGELSITEFTAKDPFTALKSVRVDVNSIMSSTDGDMFFNFVDYIKNALTLVYPDSIDPICSIYSDICAGSFDNYTNSLSVVKCIIGIGSIIGDDNNTKYCYDVISDVLTSYPYRIFFFDNELVIHDVNYISYTKQADGSNIVKVSISEQGISQDNVSFYETIETIDLNQSKFLIGDISDINTNIQKAYKTVNVKYSSDKLTSILKNSNFLQGTDYWIINENAAGNADVSIVGDGTYMNPYAMRITGDVINYFTTSDPDDHQYRIPRSQSVVAQVIPDLLGAGSTADIEVKFRTSNVTRGQANDVPEYDFTPDIYFEVCLLSKEDITTIQDLSDSTLYAYDVQDDNGTPQWSGLDKDVFIPAINTNGTIYRYLNGNVVSSSFTTSETPKDGYLCIVFYPFFFEDRSTRDDDAIYSKRPSYDLLEVNITLQNSTGLSALDNISEETYELRQNGYYSESKEIDIALNEKYNGKLSYAYRYNESGVLVNKRKSTFRETDDTLGYVDIGLLYASNYMALRRKPCVGANFSIKGMHDMKNMFGISNISDSLFASSCEYDLLNNECIIESIESNIQNKQLSITDLNDTYDYYTITNDYSDSYKYEYRNKSYDYFQKESKSVEDKYSDS